TRGGERRPRRPRSADRSRPRWRARATASTGGSPTPASSSSSSTRPSMARQTSSRDSSSLTCVPPSEPIASMTGTVRKGKLGRALWLGGGHKKGKESERPDPPGGRTMKLPLLYVVRHGDTAWTDSHQHTGRTDLPLNEHGEAAAAAIGRRLAGVRV